MVLIMDVSWTALDPSGSVSQISQFPDRLDVSATRRPSGERWGMLSSLVEEMETTGRDEAGAPGAEVSTRQILKSVELRT
jgi:hypothetical protein